MVEGPKLVAEALSSAAVVEAVFAGPEAPADILEAARSAGAPVRPMAPGVLEQVASTVSPQPVMAVVAQLDVGIEAVTGARLAVVCADVGDPGNAGTVLRTAEAAGADVVVFCGQSVDVYNPKTVRASAGSVFRVPVVVEGHTGVVLQRLGAEGLRRLGTAARRGTDYTEVDLTGPVGLVLGNEAAGLPPELGDEIDEWVTVPMAGRSESLNVGMAAAALCFEAARQRRVRG